MPFTLLQEKHLPEIASTAQWREKSGVSIEEDSITCEARK